MQADERSARGAFLSGPLPPEDLARLEAAIDTGLAARAAGHDPPDPTAPLPPLPDLEAVRAALAVLAALPEARFDVARGGPAARLAKRALALPLALLGRPQARWNAAARDVLARALRAVEDAMAAAQALRDELVVQRAALERTTAALARLEDRLARLEAAAAPAGGGRAPGAG